jgi:hypothetical protein
VRIIAPTLRYSVAVPKTAIGGLVAVGLALLALVGYIFRSWLSKKAEPHLDRAMGRVGARLSGWIMGIRGRFGRHTVDPNDIKIQVRERDGQLTGVVLDMASTIPHIRLWFNITNNSPADLTLDRMLIEMAVVEPTIYGFGSGIFERIEILRGTTVEDVNFFHNLSWAQAEQIGQHATQSKDGWTVEVSLRVRAWFYAPRAGWVASGQRIFRYESVALVGEPIRKVAPPTPERQETTERRKLIADTLTALSADTLEYARTPNNPELASRIMRSISVLKVACPPLTWYLDKLAGAVGNPAYHFDASYANREILTPLIAQAQQFIQER